MSSGTLSVLALSLQGNVAVFALGSRRAFVAQHLERGRQRLARLARLDYVVHVAALRGNVRVGKSLGIFVDQLLHLRCFVFGGRELAPEDRLNGAFGAHHGDFCGGPCKVDVGPDMFARHDVVRAAVRLPGDNRNFRHRRFGVGVEQFGSVKNDSTVLLIRAGQKAGNVDEGDQRDVECIAEAHEADGLDGGARIEHAGEHVWLIADDSYGLPVYSSEAADDVRRVKRLDLYEITVVDDA